VRKEQGREEHIGIDLDRLLNPRERSVEKLGNKIRTPRETLVGNRGEVGSIQFIRRQVSQWPGGLRNTDMDGFFNAWMVACNDAMSYDRNCNIIRSKEMGTNRWNLRSSINLVKPLREVSRDTER
jgi:hypothetical protein